MAGSRMMTWLLCGLLSRQRRLLPCLLKTCHQANVVGFYAELVNNTVRQSFEHRVGKAFGFQQVPVDMCAFWPTVQETFCAALGPCSSTLEAGSTLQQLL